MENEQEREKKTAHTFIQSTQRHHYLAKISRGRVELDMLEQLQKNSPVGFKQGGYHSAYRATGNSKQLFQAAPIGVI